MGRDTGAAVSGQRAYAAALQTEIESVMRANVIPGAVVLIKSRDKGDWQATLGTGEIGKTVPLSMADSVRIGSNTKTMTSTGHHAVGAGGQAQAQRSDLEIPP